MPQAIGAMVLVLDADFQTHALVRRLVAVNQPMDFLVQWTARQQVEKILGHHTGRFQHDGTTLMPSLAAQGGMDAQCRWA